MADMSYMPYAQRAAEIERQRKLAELLQQQYAEPIQQQTAGGYVVPISPWQTVAKLAQAGLGAYMQSKADKKAAELDTQQRKEAKEQVESYFKGLGPQKSYTSTPVMEQSSDEDRTEMAPKMTFNDITGEYEPERKWSEISTPGMNRNQALAKLLEMKGSDNKYLSDYASVLSGALPKEANIAAVDPSEFTAASLAKYEQTGDRSVLDPIVKPTSTSWEYKTRTVYDKNGQPTNQDFLFDPKSTTIRPIGNTYGGKPNYDVQQNARQVAEAERQQKEFEYNYPNLAAGSTSPAQGGVASPTGMETSAGQSPVQQTTQSVSKPLSRQDQMTYNSKIEPLNDAAIKLQNYKDAVNEVSRAGSVAGAGAGRIKAAYADALSAVRILQNTGVYNPGEAFLLDKVLRDASTLSSIVDPTSRSQIIAQLDEQFKNLNSKKGVIDQQFQQAPTPLTVGGKTSGETLEQKRNRVLNRKP